MQLHCAVRKGWTTGIFHSLPELRAATDGYEGAEYEVFASKQAALKYMRPAGGEDDMILAYTDGSGNKDRYGWGVVVVDGTQDGVFGRGYYGFGSRAAYLYCGNIAGELTAALKAMEYALEQGFKRLVIRHDYDGVAGWAVGQYKGPSRIAQSYSSMVQRFRSQGLQLFFEHVPAHTGEWGNECAHRLAGLGAAGKTLPLSKDGLLVGPSRLPEKPPRQKPMPRSAGLRAQGPFAVLLDEDVEASCIESICSIADVLDKMYGAQRSDPTSVHTLVERALRQAIPQYDAIRAAGRRSAQVSKKAERPAATLSGTEAVQDLGGVIMKALHFARRASNLRLRDVAAACGISVLELGRLERGFVAFPDAVLLQRIAEVVGCGDMPELQYLADMERDLW